MDKPDVIKRIEEKTGSVLNELPLVEGGIFEKEEWGGVRGYALNEDGAVVALALDRTRTVEGELFTHEITRDLADLERISLSDVRYKDYSFLYDLKRLAGLDFSFNSQIQDHSFISNLRDLSWLNLRENKLKDASFLADLKHLTFLDLSFNDLKDVSFLSNLKSLTGLEINHNPIEIPPQEVVEKGLTPLRNYFKPLKEQDEEKLDEAFSELNLFYSYSNEDLEYKKNLETFLASVRRKFKIQSWNDEEIIPGQEWDKEIKDKLRAADIVLFLVSAESLNSEYMMEEELPIILKRQKAGKCAFIPVILRPCDWELEEFSKYEVLPKKGLPVTMWDNRDEAWKNVAEGVREAILAQAKRKTNFEDQAQNFEVFATTEELTVDQIFSVIPSDLVWYHKRAFDDIIKTTIQNKDPKESQRSVIIVSNPLSGKTRAVYEFLKKLENYRVFIPYKEPIPSNFSIPDFHDNYKPIVFFDDIDEYFSEGNTRSMVKMIGQILKSDIPIIATCRSGPERFTLFEAKFNGHGSKLMEVFEIIEIPRLTSSDYKQFPDYIHLRIKKKKEVDRTIGSIFFELNVIRDQYKVLRRKALKENSEEFYFILLIKAIKALYYSGNIEENGKYSLEKIVSYAYKLIENNNYRNLSPLEHTATFENQISKLKYHLSINLNVYLKDLTPGLHGLGFIHSYEEGEKNLEIESVYFDNILAPEYTAKNIRDDIYKFYPNILARKKAGFYTKLSSYTRGIRKAKNFKQGEVFFNNLIDSGIKPDLIIFNSWIAIASNFDEASKLLEKITEHGLQPDVVTYTHLIRLASDYDHAKELLGQMKAEKINPTIQSYTELIGKAPLDEWKKILAYLENEGLKPDTQIFTAFIKNARYESIEELLGKIKKAGISFNIRTYTAIIEKAPNLKEKNKHLKKMTSEKIKPDLGFYNALITSSETLKEGFQYFTTLYADKIEPSTITFNSLIGLAVNPKFREKLLRDLLEFSRDTQLLLNNDAINAAIVKLITKSSIKNLNTYLKRILLIKDYNKSRLIGKLVEIGTKGAIDMANKILKSLPENSYSYIFNNGKVSRQAGSLKKAWSQFEKAANVKFISSKDQVFALNEKVRLVSEFGLEGEGFWEEARKHALEIVNDFPYYYPPYPGIHYLILGILKADKDSLESQIWLDYDDIKEHVQMNLKNMLSKYVIPIVRKRKPGMVSAIREIIDNDK